MKFNIHDDNILNCYLFGSHLYGTNHSKSDYDYIIVCKEWFDSGDDNIQVCTINDFKNSILNQEIKSLECIFSDDKFKLKETIKFEYQPNLHKLRESVSTIASNSWIKGKKRIMVEKDYNLDIALKSFYHSLRILDYGCQIASNNKISNWSNMNYILTDLYQIAESSINKEDLFVKINNKYKPVYNKISSKFKELAPKEITEKNNKVRLKNCLSKYFLESDITDDIIEEILCLLK